MAGGSETLPLHQPTEKSKMWRRSGEEAAAIEAVESAKAEALKPAWKMKKNASALLWLGESGKPKGEGGGAAAWPGRI